MIIMPLISVTRNIASMINFLFELSVIVHGGRLEFFFHKFLLLPHSPLQWKKSLSALIMLSLAMDQL